MKDKERLSGIIVLVSIMSLGMIFTMAETKLYAETEDVQTVPLENQAIEEKMVKEKIESGNITIDFKDADIRTVLRVLSEKSGVNIVAGKDVTGDITIRLSNVRWERALNIICKNYGYTFERDENIIRVTTIENLQQEELTTEVFSLNYAKANEVADAIKEMLTERGKDKIKYDARTNVLIVTDIPTNLYKIRQVVDRLDKETPQVLIEARIIETTLNDDERLGIDWNLKLSVIGAARPTTLPFTFAGTMAYLGLDPQDWNNFMPRPKGSTTVNVTSTEAGALVTETIESEFPLGITGLDISQAHDSPFPTVDSGDFTFGTLDFTQFSMIMEFLKSRQDTNILSNPRIATLNNEEAKIFVGRVYNFPTFKEVTETGRWVISGYEAKELGIRLLVTPHVNESGEIVVDLKPEIANYIGMQKISDELSAPLWSTREAETQVMVRGGQTIMIGGLIKENTIDYEKKVPLLGDIPGLGKWLFTKSQKLTERTEVILFMTVHLLSGNDPEGEIAFSDTFAPVSGETKQ